MAATTTTADVADLVARLKEREIALGDPLDVPRSTRAFEEYWRLRRTLAATITGLMNDPQQLERQQARLDDLEGRRALVEAKRAEIEKAIDEAPPWRESPIAAERDRRYDHIHALRQQLKHLAAGTLVAAPDVCYERLDVLDQQIGQVRDRRDRAQLALDGHRREAEALLKREVVTK